MVLVKPMADLKPGAGPGPIEKDQSAISEPAPRLVLEETLLALLLKMPGKSAEINQEEFEVFQDKLYNDVFKQLKSGEAQSGRTLSYEDNLRLELVRFKSEQFFGGLEGNDLENEISRLIKGLKKELVLEKIKDLEIRIKEAKSQDEVPPLLKEVQRFSSKLASL